MMLLTFQAGINRYAIEASRVIEVVPKVALRSIPRGRPELAGLLSYWGDVVPVIDLGVLLEGTPCPDRLSTRIILVREHMPSENETKARAGAHGDPARVPLGLIAANVSDLVKVAPADLTSPRAATARAPFLGPIIRVDEGLLQLILVEHLWNKTIEGVMEDSAELTEG